MSRRRPAAENPPLSTTRTNAVRLVRRSIGTSHYPLLLDNASNLSLIITPRAILHVGVMPKRPPEDAGQFAEDAMANLSYVADLHTKTAFHPSRQAIKRAALALALALGIAAAADFGYGYLTTGRYPVSYTHLTL